jgi:hypothetical protein
MSPASTTALASLGRIGMLSRHTGIVSIELNHTIVASRDAESSARWFADLFGTDEPFPFGRFWQINTANGVGLDFGSVGPDDDITSQHYAFLVTEDEFDSIYGKIVERDMDHWADPGATRPREINHNDGGRGVYFRNDDGHYLEIITRPYGSGS